MEQPTKDRENKVSLEELLQFKRAERPNDTFWNQFDSELHQRMMQTLVKKDAWYIQVSRALTAKLTQSVAIGAAAAVFAVMVIRPAFVATGEQQHLDARPAMADVASMADVADVTGSGRAIIENAGLSEITAKELAELQLIAESDYEIVMLTASSAHPSTEVTQDFGLDRIQVASYDSDAYSADMAFPDFISSGVASLVY